MKTILTIITLISFFSLTSCRKDIRGCTDPNSINYNSQANVNDGYCIPKVFGCMDPNSSNFNSAANVDNGTCQYTGYVTFWCNNDLGAVTVHIAGLTGVITIFFTSGSPGCNHQYCANFTFPIGSYSYTATSSAYTWGGDVTVP